MFWYAALGLTVVAIAAIVFLGASRWRDPYDPENQPREAPPRGSPGRGWWRRNARRGPGPGSPL